jgi:hypothetical protein
VSDLDGLLDLVDRQDWLGILGWCWDAIGEIPYGHLSVYVFLGLIALALVMLVMTGGSSVQEPEEPVLPPVGRPGMLARRFARHERPIELFGRRYDVYEKLIGIASIPGTGKSTLLAELMWQSGGRCICVSGGKSPPLIDTVYAMGGRHWEATGTLGLDLLSGEPQRIVQVLEEMFDKGAGDGGLYRMMFREIAQDRIEADDEKGIPRSFDAIIDALRRADPDQYPGITPTMRGNWITRMRGVVRSLGPAIGTDLNLVEACEQNVPVLFTLDKRKDPSGALRRLFAKAAISAGTQAVAAGYAPMFLIDEIGLLDAQAIAEDARTFREAGVLFAAAGHLKDDFGRDLRGLCDFWVFGTLAADEPETRLWASATTFKTKPPEAFGGHSLPKGSFIVWDGKRVDDTLVVPRYRPREWRALHPKPLPEHAPPPSTGSPVTSPESPVSPVPVPTPEAEDESEGPKWWREMPCPEWLGVTEWGKRLWDSRVWDAAAPDCQLSGYGPNTSGYPKMRAFNRWATTYRDGQEVPDPRVTDGVLCHRLAYDMALAEVQFDKRGQLQPGYTTGHVCHLAGATVPVVNGVVKPDKRCFWPGHLRQESEAEGTRERQARQRAAKVRARGLAAAD